MDSTAQVVILFMQGWSVEVVCALVIVVVVPLAAGYTILAQRKLLPGLLNGPDSSQPTPLALLKLIGCAFRLLMKREVAPRGADVLIFWLAPVASMFAAFISLGALYLGPSFTVVHDINIGILFIVGISSLGFLGILLGDVRSLRHRPATIVLRSTAQLVIYGLAASLAIVSAVLLCGTLKIHAIIDAQLEQRVWFIFVTPFGFLIYLVASIFGINRRPFQLPEAESNPGSASEYGGFRSTLYFLGEYAGMILIASTAATVFLGGWLRPFANVHWLNWLDDLPAELLAAVGGYGVYRAGRQPAKIQSSLVWVVALVCFALAGVLLLPRIFVALRFAATGINGAFWFLFKVFIYLSLFFWLRSTLPLWRLDQLVRLAWRILIPLATVNIFFVALAMWFETEFGWNRWLALLFGNVLTLAAAIFLVYLSEKRSAVAAITSDSYAG
jgi:NADH-quinone oxidoreductase subunit H